MTKEYKVISNQDYELAESIVYDIIRQLSSVEVTDIVGSVASAISSHKNLHTIGELQKIHYSLLMDSHNYADANNHDWLSGLDIGIRRVNDKVKSIYEAEELLDGVVAEDLIGEII